MENSRFHRAHGNLHLRGNLVVVVSIKEHCERLAEVGLQFVDRPQDVRLVDLGGHGVHTVVLAGVDEVLVLGAVKHGVLELLAFVVVNEDVPHNGVQPPFHGGTLLEVVFVAQGLHHGVLNQIVGIGPISGETEGETTQEVRLADQELIEFEGAHHKPFFV